MVEIKFAQLATSIYGVETPDIASYVLKPATYKTRVLIASMRRNKSLKKTVKNMKIEQN
jgi:hypothetical protein